MKTALSVISGIMFLAAFIPYIRAILKDGAKPSKVSWLVWAVNDTIALAAMYAADALNFMIVGAVCGAWIVTALAFRFGEATWSKLDLVCLAVSLFGLGFALIVQSPMIAIASSMAALLVGSVTTFANASRTPENENLPAWLTYWASCIVSLFAVPVWDFANAAQPVTFTIIETTVVAILLWRRFNLDRLEEMLGW